MPLPLISSGRLFLSCLVPCWLSVSSPLSVRAFRPLSISTMPILTRRRLVAESTSTSVTTRTLRAGVEETFTVTRRTRRRILTSALEVSADSNDEGEQHNVSKLAAAKEAKNAATPPVKTKAVAETPAKKPRKTSPRSSPVETRAPPKDWESTYALVEELRQDRTAPVDSDGSEALPDRSRGERVFRFQVLISLMLSSQTKDAVVGDAMRRLQEHGLDVETISQTSAETFDSLISKVGFHNRKTEYIKQTVEILKEQYGGDIPPTAEEMMKLPGVGPKMAFIIENVAWEKSTGIGIDTHMHRIFNVLKWVDSKNPEQTRKQLESWLPEDRWMSVNVLWVGFGQEVQQYKGKIIRKALDCSRSADALRLIKRLGVDLKKEGAKMGVEEEIQEALKG